MVLSQQVNIVFEFQKTCFRSCLLDIAFRKRKTLPTAIPLCFSSFLMRCFGVCSFNANELLPIDQ